MKNVSLNKGLMLLLSIVNELLKVHAASTLRVVVTVKGPRAFSTSMKKVRDLELRGQFPAFNWRCDANDRTPDYVAESGLVHFTGRYEYVCLGPDQPFARLSVFLGLDAAAIPGPNA